MLRIGRGSMAWLAEDQPATAREHVESAIHKWPADTYQLQHWWHLLALIDIELYDVNAPDTFERLGRAVTTMPKWIRVNEMIDLEAAYAHARAALASATDRDARAVARLARRQAKRISRSELPMADVFAGFIRAGAASLSSDETQAVHWLDQTIHAAHSAHMRVFEHVARLVRASITGGPRGAADREAAIQSLRHFGVKNPQRMSCLLAPGFVNTPRG